MDVYYHISSRPQTIILLVALAFLLTSQTYALAHSTAFAGPDSSAKPFPDEFSDLDEGGLGATLGKLSKPSADKFEEANTAYYAAIAKMIKHDTIRAAREFERSITLLNELYDEKEVSRLPEFTKLVKNVIEDYELYVTNIADLDQDASISILQRRMLEEIERKTTVESIAGIHAPRATTPTVKTTIPLPVNEDVQKNIDFFTVNKGRPFMKKWLERSGRWFPTLKRIAREEDMPEEIVYLAMMESGLNPNAQSWAKAVGMWQFIESTGKMYDLEINTWVDERRNVEKATRAAMRFLKDLYNDLGDWHLALAAYNCGPGGVRRAQRRSGVADGNFWDIRDRLPRETKNYVPCYVATTMIAMNPDSYGFVADSLTMMSPFAHDVYTVSEAVSTAALAKCINISQDSLEALNPELRRSCTPPNSTYKIKIPAGSKDLMHRNYAVLSESEKRPWTYHTVQRRETLQSIARKYDVSVSDLASINGVQGYKSRIRRGTKIRIPVSGTETQQTTLLAANAATPATKTPSTSSVAAKDRTEQTAEQIKTVKASNHVVRSGESLASIASQYHVNVADLRSWNQIHPADGTILPGDTLVVSVSDKAASAIRVERISTQKVVIHKVKRGETLTEIADRYNTSVNDIKKLNRLGKRNTLRYGTNLKVETTITTTRSYAGKRPSKTTQPAAESDFYSVRQGDTLSSISEKFGTSIADLRELNPSLKKTDIVRIGQRLRVQ